MSPKKSHFADINILGADFCDNYKFTLRFRGHGKVTISSLKATQPQLSCHHSADA
jgi:hypothetical protein